MLWIHDFQLFLFDLDGLLVNTEELHYSAYKQALAVRGMTLEWDFTTYCNIAHYSAEGLKENITRQFPRLKEQGPAAWELLYAEKKKRMIALLSEGAVHPMPGVAELLENLQAASIPGCVVTHSDDELVAIIRQKNPVLNTIPYWITREHYSRPKPDPECYQQAIERYGKSGDRIIGFEDTPRGIQALLGTTATHVQSVLVCAAKYPEIPFLIAKGVLHYPSFESIPKEPAFKMGII
jgi:beta-phosphoglucomutase